MSREPADFPADDATHDHAWRKLDEPSDAHPEFDQYVCEVCHQRWPSTWAAGRRRRLWRLSSVTNSDRREIDLSPGSRNRARPPAG